MELSIVEGKRGMKNGEGIKFERIRRITGYLVGTLDNWNNAKRAEEKDRVKHGVSEKENQNEQMDHYRFQEW